MGTRVTFSMPSSSPGWPHFSIPYFPLLLPLPLISRLNPDGDLSAKTILDVTLYISSAVGGGGPVGHFLPPLKRPYSISQYLHLHVDIAVSSQHIPPTTLQAPIRKGRSQGKVK